MLHHANAGCCLCNVRQPPAPSRPLRRAALSKPSALSRRSTVRPLGDLAATAGTGPGRFRPRGGPAGADGRVCRSVQTAGRGRPVQTDVCVGRYRPRAGRPVQTDVCVGRYRPRGGPPGADGRVCWSVQTAGRAGRCRRTCVSVGTDRGAGRPVQTDVCVGRYRPRAGRPVQTDVCVGRYRPRGGPPGADGRVCWSVQTAGGPAGADGRGCWSVQTPGRAGRCRRTCVSVGTDRGGGGGGPGRWAGGGAAVAAPSHRDTHAAHDTGDAL
jgi:hypothetical protein